MADDKKRTLRGVYDGLQKISKEEGVDFGIGKYNYEDFEKKYGTKNNLSLLWKSLSDISNESGLDFGIGTADEWLQSFAYDGSSRVVDGNRMPAAVAVGAGMQQPAVQVPFVQGGKSASVSKPKSQSLYAGMNYDATKRSVNNATYDTSSHTMRGVVDEQRALTAEEKATLKERQGATREQAKEVRGQIESGVADVKERRRMQEAAMNELRRRIDPIEADKIAISNGLYKGMGKAGLRYNPQTRRMEKVPDDYGMSEKTDDELKEIISGNITVKDNRNYNAADRALRNAERMIAEADHNANGGFEGSFVAGAARGFGQKFGDASTWDLGITDLGDNLAFMDVLKKADQGKALTESEQTMLDSKVLEIATSEYFGSELGRGYKAGGVTAESIPFMVEMMVNPLAGAGKGAENMLARYAMKRFGKKAVEKEIKKNIKKGMTKEAAEAAARQTAAPIAKRAAAIAEKDLGYKIAKGAVRGAGDIAAAAGIAATTGAVRTVADAVDRMSGDVHFNVDAAGHNVFDYVDNKKDWLTAFRKAYLGTMIENYSEMFGNYFGPLLGWFGNGAGHVGKALRLDRVQDALNNMSRSDWARLVGDFEKRVQWHGGIGEFAEEIVGGVLNSIFVGDQTLDTDKQTGVFNLDNLIDTFLGVGLMSGAFSAVKTGGYAYGRHRLNKADAAGREAFGDDWDDMQKSLTVEDDAAVKARLKEIYNDGNLTQEQKRAAYEYAGRAAGFRGMLQSRSQAKEEPEANPTEQAVMESFDNGYEQAVEPEAREDVYTWLKGAREELRQMVGDEMLERIEEEPLVVKAEMDQDGAVDDNVMQAVNDYIAGRAFTEGVEQRIRDDAEDEADAERAELQKKVNPVDGNVHPAMMVVDGQETEVYHVDGNVMMDDQGALDAEKSDLTVVVYNPVTGKREMVDPKLLTFVAVQSGDALEEQISADAAARVEREINTAQGRITAGMQFPMEDGAIATVTSVNGNDVEYVRPDGQTGTLPLDQTQAIIDGALLEKYQQKYGSRQQEERQQPQDNVMEGVPEMEDIEPETVLVMKDGRRLVVLGWSKTQKNSDTGRWEQVLADDGKNLAYYDMETPDKVQYAMKPQDIIKDVVGYIPVAEESAEEVTETPAESAAEEPAQETETVGESAEEEAAADEPAEEKTPAQEMYEAVVAKHGAKAGHKIEITINEVDKLVDGKKKAVDTAQKKLDDAPVIGNAEAKAQAALDKALAAYDEALAQRKLWYEVKIIHDDVMKAERAAQEEDRAKRRAAYDEQRKAEEAQRAAEEEEARKRKEEAREQSMRRAKEQEELDLENEVFDDVRKELGGEYMRGAIDRKRAIDEQVSMKQKRAKAREIYGEFYNDDLETPADVYEYVASKLPGVKINWDMVDGKFGVLQEIGSNMSRRGGKNKGEFNGFDSLISFDNTGVSFQQAAHNMWDNAENVVDGGYKLFDEQDIRNAMIELLSSSENVSDITQYAFKNRVNNAEEMLEQSNGESLSREVEWRIQQSGMTFAEYMAWYKYMKDKAAAVDGMTEEEYNNIILGEYGNRETEESIDGAQPSAPVVGEERPRESGDDGGSGEEGAEEMRGTEGEPTGTVSDAGRGDEEAAGGEGSRGNGEVEQKNQDNNGQTERTDIDRRDTGNGVREEVSGGREPQGDNNRSVAVVLGEQVSAERLGDLPKGSPAAQRAVGEQVIEKAKEDGYYIDPSSLKDYGERVSGQTGESDVYLDVPNGRVIKVKDIYAKAPMKGHSDVDALYEHEVHNLLFPNSAYRLLGVSEKYGDMRLVLEQDYVDGADRPATMEQIEDYLVGVLGLKKEGGGYWYGNDYYAITDVDGDNVLVDKNGELHFVDPIIKFKKPAKEVIDYITASRAIYAAEAQTDTNPTDAQKEAGNYKKGHIKLDGYDITIEQPKGSVRSGVDPDGKAWSQEMHNTYGYIRGTEGVDGDHIDVFLSDDPQTGDVFVVDQVNKDGSFDEHKVMYGFPDMESARHAYLSNYEEGWTGLGAITHVSKEEFKKWIESSHRKTKPFSEYKSVETLGDVRVENMPAEQPAGEVDEQPKQQKTGEGESSKTTKRDKAILGALVDKLREFLGKNRVVTKLTEAEKAVINWANAKMKGVAQTFYSNAWRAVKDIKQEKATAEQWLKMIEKNGGLKSGEDKWTGLSEWLKEKGNASLTKQEVIDYLFENAIDVEEVEYAENVDMREQTEEFIQETFADGKSIEELQEEVDANAESADRYDRLGDDPEQSELDEYLMKCMVYEYGDDFRRGYVIKDGKIECDPQAFIDTEDTVEYNSEVAGDDNKAIDPTRLDYTTGGLKNKREIALTVPNIEPWGENDVVHFGDAGYGRAIGWARFGETTDKDGNRVLVIDEIQSKRHQEGREKGYKMPAELQRLHRKMQSGNITNEEVARYNELAQQEGSTKTKQLLDASVKAQDDYDAYMQQMSRKYGVSVMNVYSIMSGEDQKEADRLEKAVYDADAAYQNYSPSDIPDAPFDKNWHELVMKRMLRYAAENGYDKVAWTKGEQQAERYDLSKSIKDMTATGWTDYSALRGDDAKEAKLIAINTIDGGEYAQLLVDKSGKVLSDVDDQFVGKQLSDVVGKDLAKRLMEDGYQTIEGDGLRIGGEGMKGFYDQILPRFMDKYGKKWGVKTTDIELPNIGDNGLTMHSVEVTPEMKRSVMEGQPMFHKVFHGSSADFERFDSSHMGEGEGAQAYGYGHYTTEVEGIGRTYAKMIGMKPNMYYKSNLLKGEVGLTKNTAEEQIAKLIGLQLRAGYTFKEAIYSVKKYIESGISMYGEQKDNDAVAKYQEMEKIIPTLKESDFKIEQNNHILYTVDIPVDNGSNYMEWDKKPNKEVREKIQKALDDAGQKHIIGKEAEGQRIYKELSGLLGSDKAASEFLHNAGFTGIKYPAQYRSGGREDNSKNYVIFDDNDLKITDKMKFFRTPDGEAFGFTVGGKIYIDMDIAKADTAVHEYTHMWVPMVKESDPKMWQEIKDVLTKDKDVQPFMEIVRQRYPELTADGREDDFMEEVLAHFSGAKGLERLEEAAKEYEEQDGQGIVSKAKAMVVLNKVKSALEKFWGKVAELFGIKFRNAQEIADKVLNDLLHGVDPTAVRSEREEKTLMGVHNISEEKLKKALKNGGFANPSMAVIDTKNGGFDSYGDISLIPRSSLIDARTGRNAGTYSGDAYTPIYPNVEYYEGKETENKLQELTSSLPQSLGEYIRRKVSNYMDRNSNNSGLEYLFLKEHGIDMPIVHNERRYPGISTKQIADRMGVSEDLYGSDLYKEYKKMPEDQRFDFNLWLQHYGNEEDIAKVKNLIAEMQEKGKEKEANYLIDNYTKPMNFAHFDSTVYNVSRDEREAGKENLGRTVEDAAIEVNKQGLRNEFDAWQQKVIDGLGYEEKLFAGYTPSGTRKYLPNTAENASKLMNKQEETNAGNDTGLNATRAALLYKMQSLDDIRQHRDLLQGNDAYGERQSEMTYELLDLAHQLSDMQKIDDNPFMNTDYAILRMQEAFTKKDPIAYLNKEYGYSIDKESEFAKQMLDFIKEVKDLPAKYFETKFKRPVALDEFAVAVVPDGTSQDVVDALKAAGLDVRTYDGTPENRQAVTMEAVRGRDDIMFQKVGGDENDNRKVNVVGAEKEHGFKNFNEARTWAKKNIVGEYENPEIGNVNISGTAIDKYLSEKAVSKSSSKDVHLSALKVMPSIIENSIVGEVHDDKNGSENVKDIVRLYGAIDIDGQTYRVKTTVKRYNNENEKTKAYSYEVTEIELLEGTHGDETNNPLPRTTNNSISAAKLLNNYETAKNNLQNAENEGENDGTMFRSLDPESDEVVDNAEVGTKPLSDREKVAKLDAEPKVKVYRSMQLIDGKLYPPMSAKVDGQLREPSELGVWEEADEAPDMADENGKFKLDKGNKKSLKAAYNPYIHTSRTMLNDQFSEAQDRPNLVVVEMEVPESELTSGYKAEKAKDSVGAKQWKAGVIQGQLSGTREVILSRWAKPVRIVPTDEVAESIAKQIEGQVHVMPSNVVTPDVRKALEARGVKFVETDNTGKINEGENAGKTWASVYGKGKTIDAVMREGDAVAGEPRSYEDALRVARAAGYTKKQFDAKIERQERAARKRFDDLVEKLNLGDRVTIVETIDELDGLDEATREARRDKKGWYNKKSGKIVVILGNHRSPDDVVKTILHEGVAHHGLRAMFGERFDTFLDNVYDAASDNVRQRIDESAERHGWDKRTATEEYLASLAEDADFENPEVQSWWEKVKTWFLGMLHDIGEIGFNPAQALTDNELRYMLWRSYKNLTEPGRYRSFVDTAEDVSMQWSLKVGDYEEEATDNYDLGEEHRREYLQSAETDNGALFRDGDVTERDRVVARDAYERRVASGWSQFKEAMQDSMLSLKEGMLAIMGGKGRIDDIPGNENAWLAENAMSSVNAAEQTDYYHTWMQPLLKAVHDICGNDEAKRQEMTDYMMAKHGLERNVKFAERDAMEAAKKGADYTQAYNANRNKDYAGLTALTGESDVTTAELMASLMVADFEAKHDTTELWEKVNDATKSTLAKLYVSGIISKETYEYVRDMFDNYIPLRGFDETTSEDVYGYLTSNAALNSSIMKHAEGRSSKSDDPIATIGLMADTAIRQANRNEMKKRFLNFVLNHPSDLVSVNPLWLEYDSAHNEWIPVFADIDASDTPEQVEKKVEAFEQKMAQLAAQHPDKYKSGVDAVNIPYKVMDGNMREHQVLVKRGGETYVLTVNGNPRMAQALNGLTNPDVNVGGVIGNMLKLGEAVNHQLSAFYTTRTPDFVVSNFFRDMLYSNCMTWVKESPSYAVKFHKNFGKVNPVTMRRLFGKWEKGTLDDSVPMEMMFKQFMLNGGETGYTNIRDIEAQKRAIAEELKRQGSVPRKAWHALGMQLDLLNRSVENCARFAAFLTSMEMGRSVERSIYDAKEVSVNFNKKGAGGKMVNTTGQTFAGKIGSYMSGGGRLLYVFWNAGVQGMTNFGRAAKREPVKFTAGVATMFTLGAVIPMLAQMMSGGGDGDDDDENAYYNIPEYVRRSNICIRVGKQWLTIPLPIEFRAIYGLGELATGAVTGKERHDGGELAKQIISQVSQILPLDFMEGSGGMHAFVPSVAKPFVEAYSNKAWTGLPIYRDNPFNQRDPEFTKVYKSADKYIVGASRMLNEATGGDDYMKGWADVVNPSQVEYVLNGYFGGWFKVPNQLIKMTETALGQRDFEWRNMMLANRLVKSGDERTAYRKLQNEYFNYKEEYENTKRLLKKYENAADEGVLKYAEKLDYLNNSPEYARYEIFDKYNGDIETLYDLQEGEEDSETRKAYEAEYYELIGEMVKDLRSVEEK